MKTLRVSEPGRSGVHFVIPWQHGWRAFDLPGKEEYFLRELRWEIEENPGHPLHGRELRIVGWIPGYDDFLLYLPTEAKHAHVHLTWTREGSPAFPHCVMLDSLDAVKKFMEHWGGEE